MSIEAAPLLLQLIGQPAPPAEEWFDAPGREESLGLLCDLVSSTYGADGVRLGQLVRQSGGLLTLSWLLLDEDPEIVRLVLFLLANLSSDAVDRNSYLTKTLLLQCGTEFRVLPYLCSDDMDVMTYALAAVQNLSHDEDWAKVIVEHGVQPRLEELIDHEDNGVVRYASGTLKNISAHMAAAHALGFSMGVKAKEAVERRGRMAALQALTERRATRIIHQRTHEWLASPSRTRRHGEAGVSAAQLSAHEAEEAAPPEQFAAEAVEAVDEAGVREMEAGVREVEEAVEIHVEAVDEAGVRELQAGVREVEEAVEMQVETVEVEAVEARKEAEAREAAQPAGAPRRAPPVAPALPSPPAAPPPCVRVGFTLASPPVAAAAAQVRLSLTPMPRLRAPRPRPAAPPAPPPRLLHLRLVACDGGAAIDFSPPPPAAEEAAIAAVQAAMRSKAERGAARRPRVAAALQVLPPRRAVVVRVSIDTAEASPSPLRRPSSALPAAPLPAAPHAALDAAVAARGEAARRAAEARAKASAAPRRRPLRVGVAAREGGAQLSIEHEESVAPEVEAAEAEVEAAEAEVARLEAEAEADDAVALIQAAMRSKLARRQRGAEGWEAAAEAEEEEEAEGPLLVTLRLAPALCADDTRMMLCVRGAGEPSPGRVAPRGEAAVDAAAGESEAASPVEAAQTRPAIALPPTPPPAEPPAAVAPPVQTSPDMPPSTMPPAAETPPAVPHPAQTPHAVPTSALTPAQPTPAQPPSPAMAPAPPAHQSSYAAPAAAAEESAPARAAAEAEAAAKARAAQQAEAEAAAAKARAAQQAEAGAAAAKAKAAKQAEAEAAAAKAKAAKQAEAEAAAAKAKAAKQAEAAAAAAAAEEAAAVAREAAALVCAAYERAVVGAAAELAARVAAARQAERQAAREAAEAEAKIAAARLAVARGRAAVILQCRARQMHARRRAAAERALLPLRRQAKEARAAAALQKVARGKRCRRLLGGQRRSATRMQAAWRGYRLCQLFMLVRLLVGRTEEEAHTRAAAVLTLQKYPRRYLAMESLRRARRAATLIAAHFRGYLARAILRWETAAAVRLQASWRGVLGMRKAISQRVELLILIRLQSQWRSRKYKIAYNVVRSLVMTLEIQAGELELQNRTAVTLQRTYHERRQWKLRAAHAAKVVEFIQASAARKIQRLVRQIVAVLVRAKLRALIETLCAFDEPSDQVILAAVRIQTQSRVLCARNELMRLRKRAMLWQQRMDFALRVTLGKQDMFGTLPWDAYSQATVRRAADNQQLGSLFGGPPARRRKVTQREVGLTSTTSAPPRGGVAPAPPPRDRYIPHPPPLPPRHSAVEGAAFLPTPPAAPLTTRPRPRGRGGAGVPLGHMPVLDPAVLRPLPPPTKPNGTPAAATPSEGARSTAALPRLSHHSRVDHIGDAPQRDGIAAYRDASDVERELMEQFGPHPALLRRFRNERRPQPLVGDAEPPQRVRPAWASPRKVRDAAAHAVGAHAQGVGTHQHDGLVHGVATQPGMQYLDIHHLSSLKTNEPELRLPPISPRAPWVGTGRTADTTS